MGSKSLPSLVSIAFVLVLVDPEHQEETFQLFMKLADTDGDGKCVRFLCVFLHSALRRATAQGCLNDRWVLISIFSTKLEIHH